jgi:hypothetical protein
MDGSVKNMAMPQAKHKIHRNISVIVEKLATFPMLLIMVPGSSNVWTSSSSNLSTTYGGVFEKQFYWVQKSGLLEGSSKFPSWCCA